MAFTRAQRDIEPSAVVQHRQRGTQVTSPVTECGQPPAVVVGEVLDVEQRTAAGDEPPQQLLAALLALVGMPEVDVPVPKLSRLGGQLLQPDHERLGRCVRPAVRRHQSATGVGVIGVGETPLR
ncbi:MAG TPA: hypothetical protein VJ851_13855 [Jatrophihabitans sp.]|nr:hypothetical protein [Jatrophihabitans sp.]